MTDYLHQTEEWHPKEGDPVRIADMDDVWRLHAARFMERQAPGWAQRYEMASVLAWGGGASDDGWFDQAEDPMHDPVRWVGGLPLYRALLDGLPSGGSELDSLRERARHWSTCPTRKSLEASCNCTPTPTVAPLPAGLARTFRDLGQEVAKPAPLVIPQQPSAPGVDPTTGRPWGVDADGFDHNQPHLTQDGCWADSCSGCFGYHCGWYCSETSEATS